MAENSGVILNCSVAGSISGRADGLVRANAGTIMYCRSTASVTGGSGLAGENSGTIVACSATGDVTDGPAGLVGENSGTIRYSYATGDVQASEDLAGGLVAANSGGISYCYATGNVWAEGKAAGLVASNEGIITHCYATGSGGMALVSDEYGDGMVLGCYALAEADGGGINDGLSIVLTDMRMRRQECFVGWDFTGTNLDGSFDHWTMPDDGGYPILTTIEGPDSVGTGTPDDPYLIEAYPQLLAVSREPTAWYRLLNDIGLEGQSFSIPIIPAFWGHLDGADHSISNFVLTGDQNLGVFGTLYPEAIVTNLSIRRARVMLVSEQYSPESTGIGILAARNRGMISGCSVIAEVAVSSSGLLGNVGGLIGINEAGEIHGCSARISLGYQSLESRGALDDCGGLVGTNTGTIHQCHASIYGNVAFQCLGGLIGRNAGSVADCYADGYVSGSFGVRMPSVSFIPLGGLIGFNTGSVSRCHAVAGIIVASNVTALFHGGGLVGENLEGPIVASYFLSEADGGGPVNGWGTALSDTGTKHQASYVGWDFETVWTMCEGKDYPRLRWEGVVCEE